LEGFSGQAGTVDLTVRHKTIFNDAKGTDLNAKVTVKSKAGCTTLKFNGLVLESATVTVVEMATGVSMAVGSDLMVCLYTGDAGKIKESTAVFNDSTRMTVRFNTQQHLDSAVVVLGNVMVEAVLSLRVRDGELGSQGKCSDATAADWL